MTKKEEEKLIIKNVKEWIKNKQTKKKWVKQ